MNQSKKRTMYIVHAAVIAALYVVLTYIAAGFDLASGAIQVRFSECLTIMPFFTNAAVPGVTIGCLLANIITGSPAPDVIFGTMATLIGALGTYALRKNRYLCSIPPVISNAIIIPFVLRYAYGIADGMELFGISFSALPAFAITVGIGEIITCVIFGQILISALLPVRSRLFPADDQVQKSAK